METAGILKCFKQSEQLNKVRYTNYIGDGDSKSYAEVVKADPYNGVKINKLECIGHVQKRVGSNLRNFKKECKEGKVAINSKQVSVVQKLTRKNINKLQNCYGIAVGQYCNKDVPTLRKAVGAVLYHYSESRDPQARHLFFKG